MFSIFRTALTIDDLLEELFRNPLVQIGLVCTISAAITIPFAVALAFRLWRHLRLRWLQRVQRMAKADCKPIGENAADKAVDGSALSWCFNAKIIETLYHVPLEIENDTANGDSLKVTLITDQDENRNSANDANVAQANVKVQNKGKKKKKQLKIETSKTDDELKSHKNNIKAIDNNGDSDNINSNEGEKNGQKSWKIVTEPDEATAEALKNLSDAGLHGKLATAQLRAKTSKIEQSMSDEERRKENEIRQAQLNAIFQMMQNQGNKFGLNDKDDLVEQMKLYNV